MAPGVLVEQWQDELHDKFGLPFDILTRDRVETSRTGNPFNEHNLLIARLDMLSRDPELQSKLAAAKEWDLVVCDEAHRMSASFFGGEVKYTKPPAPASRWYRPPLRADDGDTPQRQGRGLPTLHGALGRDRFEGRFRDGVHQADVSDLMRRLTKEELLRFDGRPLFPERRADTVQYELSKAEAALSTRSPLTSARR